MANFIDERGPGPILWLTNDSPSHGIITGLCDHTIPGEGRRRVGYGCKQWLLVPRGDQLRPLEETFLPG